MLTTIGTILLFILPIVLLFFTNQRIYSLSRIILDYSALILLFALVSQWFGFFNKTNIFLFIILINLLCIGVVIKRGIKKDALLSLNFSRKNILVLIVFVVFGIFLFKPYFAFVGEYVKNGIENFDPEYGFQMAPEEIMYAETPQKYTYPMYSDEWVAFGFVDRTSESGKISSFDFLSQKEFINYFIPFYSFVSFFYVLLNMSLETYFLIGIFFNLSLLCVLYLLLKKNNVGSLPALCATFFVILGVNSSTLTGLWNFIPLNLGVLFFLYSLLVFNQRAMRNFIVSALMSLLFYVPLILFYIPLFGYVVYVHFSKVKENIILYKKWIIAGLFLFLYIIIFKNSFVSKSWDLIFRDSVYPGIESFPLYYVLPIFVIFLAFSGMYIVYKRSSLIFICTITSLCMWLYYEFTSDILIIDKSRVVFVAILSLCMCAGFTIDFLIKRLTYKSKEKVLWCLLLLLMVFSYRTYTSDTSWKNLVLVFDNGSYSNSLPPMNHYYDKNDIEIFDMYEDKVFTTNPWKSLIIGSVTSNKPLYTKGSYIGTAKMDHNLFMSLDCTEKTKQAVVRNINLVYGAKFECPNFDFIAEGSRGYFLYEFNILKNNL